MDEKRRISVGEVLLSLLKAGCGLALFLGSQLLVSVGAVTVVTLLHPELTAAELEARITAQSPLIMVISGVLTLLAVVLFFLLRKQSPLRAVGLVPVEDRLVGTAAAITPALYVVVTLAMAMIPEHLMESYDQASASLDGSDMLTMLATVFFAPLVEEIIFRGVIQSRLERVMPGWLACLLAALLFGLCHGQWIWMTYAFVMGFLFGRMRQVTGSLLPSLVAHAVFNTIGFLLGAMTSEDSGGGIVLALLVLAIAFAVLVRGRIGELFGLRRNQMGKEDCP